LKNLDDEKGSGADLRMSLRAILQNSKKPDDFSSSSNPAVRDFLEKEKRA